MFEWLFMNKVVVFSNFVAYMDDIYENIEKCNQDKEHKILIKFDNMIVDKLSKKD